jgi:hypothetical protein
MVDERLGWLGLKILLYPSVLFLLFIVKIFVVEIIDLVSLPISFPLF